jgi:hypothetical protein
MTEHEAGLPRPLAWGLFSSSPYSFFIFVGSQVLIHRCAGAAGQLPAAAIPTADGFDFLQRIIDQTIDLRFAGLIGIWG